VRLKTELRIRFRNEVSRQVCGFGSDVKVPENIHANSVTVPVVLLSHGKIHKEGIGV
jgi:hypothetical protein